MKEIWHNLNISGYDILVSSSGRIKTVRHFYDGRWFNGHLLKTETNTGKERVAIRKRHYMVHILVAKAFPEICGKWFDGCQVHHKDQNPLNNRADNLVCLSADEHKQIHYALGKNQKEKNPFSGKHHTDKSKLILAKSHRKPVWQMDLDGNKLVYWFSVTDCERETGMDKAAINRVCLGKQHTSYGYRWCYASSSPA